MKDEKELLYKCFDCPKEIRIVYVVKEDGKVKQKCQKCYYGKNGKPDTKN